MEGPNSQSQWRDGVNWNRLINRLHDPTTANEASLECHRFIVAELVAGEGGKSLRPLARRLDLMDVANSTMGSFWKVSKSYEDKDGDEVRQILLAIIRNKKTDQFRNHLAEKRDIRKEESATDEQKELGQEIRFRGKLRPENTSLNGKASLANNDREERRVQDRIEPLSISQLSRLVSNGKSPELAAQFRDVVEAIPDQLREVLVLTLMGYTGQEISEVTGVSRRAVVRKQGLIRQSFHRLSHPE